MERVVKSQAAGHGTKLASRRAGVLPSHVMVPPVLAHVMAAFLSGKTWWPLFPMLLLMVVTALSAAVVLAVKVKVAKADLGIQVTALGCYLLTAVVAMASEGGALSPHIHRLPSLLTQAILLAQLVRIWRWKHARSLRTLNLIAWGGILADTALHYLITVD